MSDLVLFWVFGHVRAREDRTDLFAFVRDHDLLFVKRTLLALDFVGAEVAIHAGDAHLHSGARFKQDAELSEGRLRLLIDDSAEQFDLLGVDPGRWAFLPRADFEAALLSIDANPVIYGRDGDIVALRELELSSFFAEVRVDNLFFQLEWSDIHFVHQTVRSFTSDKSNSPFRGSIAGSNVLQRGFNNPGVRGLNASFSPKIPRVNEIVMT